MDCCSSQTLNPVLEVSSQAGLSCASSQFLAFSFEQQSKSDDDKPFGTNVKIILVKTNYDCNYKRSLTELEIIPAILTSRWMAYITIQFKRTISRILTDFKMASSLDLLQVELS